MRRILLAVLIAWPGAAWAQVFEGQFHCERGQPRVVLRFTERAVGRAPDVAILEFGPSARSPNQPNGSYTLVGRLGFTTINLQPVEWINQPPGYAMIGLNGTSDEGRTYRGSIATAAQGCTAFTLMMVSER